jgi:hypothetical protein
MTKTTFFKRFSNPWKSFQSLETFGGVFSNHWKNLKAVFQSLETAVWRSKRMLEGGAPRRRLRDAVSQSSTLQESPCGLNCERRMFAVNAVRRACVLAGAVLLVAYGAQAEDLHGLNFDGRAYVVVTNAADIRLDDSYTVEMWVKPSAGSGNGGLFNKGNGWVGGAKCLTIGGFLPGFALCNVVAQGDMAGPKQRLVASQWAHLAWTVENIGGDQRVYRSYVNGALNGIATNKTLPDEGFLELGRYANCCDVFVGEMCDVRYWNTLRSQDQINEYMLVPPVGNTNLLAHWLYDQGEGTQVLDSAGSHDGVLMNAGSGSNLWRAVDAAPGVVSAALKGLWIGGAAITKVSRAPTSDAQTNSWDYTPVETAQSFPLRLIVHVDENGGMRLLPEVYLAGETAWVTVTNYSNSALTNASSGTVVSNEVWQYGVYSSAGSIPAERQGRVQRFASSAFPSTVGAVVLFGETNSFSGNVDLAFDDPLNPFVHLFHPDHDNKDANDNALSNGVESWTVRRRVTLEFLDSNPQMANDPHWKVDRWGGIYRERIEGVSRFDVYVEGEFSLQKVSGEGSID